MRGKLITSGPRKGQRQPARLQGIADVKDLTDRENGTRLVVECKVGVNPQALLADLYRLTPLEQSFGVNNLVLVDGQPPHPGAQGAAGGLPRPPLRGGHPSHRRTAAASAQERLHLVDGLLIALIDIDEVVRLIRGSDERARPPRTR